MKVANSGTNDTEFCAEFKRLPYRRALRSTRYSIPRPLVLHS